MPTLCVLQLLVWLVSQDFNADIVCVTVACLACCLGPKRSGFQCRHCVCMLEVCTHGVDTGFLG